MEEVLVHLYQDVQIISKKTVHFVTQNVSLVIKELVLYVGKVVQIISEMMVHSVLNLNLMVEEQVMLYGIKINVKENINKVVKNMVCCTILNVGLDTMLLVVVYVHLIVLMV